MRNIKRCRVLFCTGSFKTGSGGVASYAHDFIQAFPEFQFVVVTQDDYQKTDESYDILKINMEDWSKANAFKFLEIIKNVQPDIIINSYCKLLALITPYIPNSIKVVSVSHFTDGGYAWAAGFNGNYADILIALSNYAKLYLEKKFSIVERNKVKVVYNFMPALMQNSLSFKKNREVLKIVYPGGHSWQKSAEIVASAIQRLCKTNLSFELYWIGNVDLPGRNWPFTRTRTILDCLPMNDARIKFVGRVERDMAKKIIADANIFLLPSRGEGCPISLLEAMRSGCIPIISDAKHGSLDIIEDGVTGYIVKQNSVSDLVDRIAYVINNHICCLYIYDNALKFFSENLEYRCWKNNMNQILYLPMKHMYRMEFCLSKYKKDVFYMKSMYFYNWARDRFVHQIYHVLYFRYLHFRKIIAFN